MACELFLQTWPGQQVWLLCLQAIPPTTPSEELPISHNQDIIQMIEQMQQPTLVLQTTCQASVHALQPCKMPSRRCENVC